jgi:hypothetical protein
VNIACPLLNGSLKKFIDKDGCHRG